MDRLLKKAERDEVYDSLPANATVGAERIALCQAQDAKTAHLVAQEIFAEIEKVGVLCLHYYTISGNVRQDEYHATRVCPRCKYEALKERWLKRGEMPEEDKWKT